MSVGRKLRILSIEDSPKNAEFHSASVTADSKEVSEWHDACTIPVKDACHPATVSDLHRAELGGENTA